MRNTNFTQALTSVRKISARATFTDKLMRFAVLQASESVRIPEGTYFFDVKVIENTAEVYTKARGEITFFYDITKAVS